LLKYDWKITTQDFYEYPNIKLLSERVTCKISYTDEFIEINTEKKRFTPVFHGTKPNEGCIFITGSTGFLGAHLLDTIIRKTNYTVYCLVRESTYERACRKLADRLDFYFKNSNYKQLFNNRIYVVKGDFTLHKLGLSDNEYDSLGKRIQCIIHSGALVNHYGNPEIFEKTNIFGTEQIADLAEQFDKPLAHISTTSVSGISVSPCNKIYEFTENDIYYGQEFNNIYIKTKHLAEDFIVNEISRNKLKASIYRIGNLTGRFSDGVFQINSSDNLFYNRVYSIIKLGFIPENYLGMVVDLTPVDYCCDAILQMIMKYYDRSDIYHIYNNHQISILQLVNLLNRIGKHIEIRDFDQFNNKLSKMYDKNTNENSIYSFINDMNEYFLFKNTVRLNSNKTLKLLKNVGFEWPICNEDYISRLYGNIEQDKSLIVEDVV
jgi:thioester reductase-like protein